MKLPKFKNAIVYRATLPGIENMEAHLGELPYSDIGENELARTSFVPNPITGELVTPIAHGFAFCVRRDEKILPRQVIAKEANERIARIEADGLCKLPRKARQQIAEQVCADLVKKAFVKSSLTLGLYNQKDKLLIINTSSTNVAGLVVAMLVKAVGSVKTETINVSDVKHGLTTRLKNYIAGDSGAFEKFTPGSFFQLSRKAEKKETIRYSAENESVTGELDDSLNSGFTVDSMELVHNGMSFVLTSDFNFRRINTGDTSPDDKDDKSYAWRHETGADMFMFSAAVNDLCNLLEYKEEQKPAA